MSDQHIIFSPEHNQWTLADGRHHMEVPEWAREIIREEFERETRPLHDSLDLALDSKRIAERDLKDLQAENEKLRELVSWMYDRMDESCAVQHPYAPAPISYDRLMQALARARELGVEVDG